jgi:hypothetical protein
MLALSPGVGIQRESARRMRITGLLFMLTCSSPGENRDQSRSWAAIISKLPNKLFHPQELGKHLSEPRLFRWVFRHATLSV